MIIGMIPNPIFKSKNYNKNIFTIRAKATTRFFRQKIFKNKFVLHKAEVRVARVSATE